MRDRISLLRCCSRFWNQWRRSASGGIAISFAMALPVLLGVVGLATDYAVMTKVRSELQDAADAAAMAGAREIPLAMSNAKQVASAVQAFAAYRLTQNAAATASDLAGRNLSMTVDVLPDFTAVKVSISEQWQPFFMHFVDKTVTPITVTSQARFVGHANICVLGLAGGGTSVFLDKNAKLTGNNCGVFANSTGSSGLKVGSGAVLTSTINCSAGGVSVSGSVTPAAITDCPPVENPLVNRTPVTVGGCDFNGVILDSVSRTINPGVYCGGLTIKGTAKITFNPGIYVIRDGGLSVSGQADVSGTGVGFYITGAATNTIFTANTHVSLKAPVDGPMAGLLFFEDPKLKVKLKHKISSDDARVLLGTIYFPVGGLVVDAKQPVADKSAYTAIVAQSLELNSGPNLILNSDYQATDVPVPAGIAGSSQVVLQN